MENIKKDRILNAVRVNAVKACPGMSGSKDVDRLNAIQTCQRAKLSDKSEQALTTSKQKESKTDWANDLNEDLRKGLEKSLIEAGKGKMISNEDAMKQIKIRYNL